MKVGLCSRRWLSSWTRQYIFELRWRNRGHFGGCKSLQSPEFWGLQSLAEHRYIPCVLAILSFARYHS